MGQLQKSTCIAYILILILICMFVCMWYAMATTKSYMTFRFYRFVVVTSFFHSLLGALALFAHTHTLKQVLNAIS